MVNKWINKGGLLSVRVMAILWIFLVCMSFAGQGQSPGGVSSNLNVWLKGDAGTSALSTSWEDQSGNSRHYVTVAGPTVQSTALNFNPAVEILSGGFNAPAGAALGTDWSMFFVAKKLASDNDGRLFEAHSGNYLWGYWGTWERSIYIDGNPFEVNTGIGVNNGGTSLSLQSYTRNNSSGALEARHNGQSLKTFTSSNSASGVRVDINEGAFRVESSDSHIGEFIIYNSALGAIDVQKVESYLGIKYGLTLGQNYLASDGTIIWNTTTNSAYQNAVAGIGRDDNSALDQRKSKSVEGGSVVTIDKGAVFTSDADFVVWGHDNAATTFTSSNVPSGLDNRMVRVWKAAVTGSPGTVSVSFEVTTPFAPDRYKLLLDGVDSDFSTGATEHTTGVSVSGNTVTFTDVPLANGMFFTLARSEKAPGGVVSNLSVWLKANVGTNTTVDGSAISSWQDQSGNGNNFSQSTASSQPAYALTSSNFNPAITFDGSDLLSGPDTNYTGGVVFAVVNGTDNGNFAHLLDGSGTSIRYEQNLNTGRLGYTRYGVSDYSSTVTTPFGRVSIISFSKASAATSHSIDELSNGTRSNATLDVGLATAGIPTFQMGIGLLGDVSEMIIYNNTLSTTDKSKVESYLSLKHGLTLDQNYLASDGSILWNSTTNASYHNDVAGIGRDDQSELDQRKSKSVESSSIVTIDKGAAFSSDAAFVVWGHDNAATTFTSTNVPSGMDNRMLRVWKAAITGSPGTVSVSFEVTTPLAADRYKLLLDGTDSDFSAGATEQITGVSVSGNTVTFTDVPLTDGMFFTLGTYNVGPGGIPSNLNVWLKGDAGTSALSTSWEDQSGNNRHYVTVAGPTVQSTALNFNPAVEILSGGFNAPAGAALGTDWSMFFVAKKLASDNDGRLFEAHSGNYLWGYWGTWERSIYIDGNPFEVNTGIGVNNGGTNLSLQSYTRNNSSGALEARHNGQSLKTFTSSNSASGVRVDINEGAFRVESSDSHIGEFIIYNSALGAIDVQKVESYLGIKYGLTLGQNYLASDGTIIWNATNNSAYQNAVAGIGRDDNSNLDQRKSKSVESGSVVTIDKGAVFTSNSAFVVWGHDNAATTFTSSNVPSGLDNRMVRVWKAAVTGSPGTVSVSFEVTTPLVAGRYKLLLDGVDSDFSAGATEHITGVSVSGNIVTFTDVPLANGMFFTLARSEKAPGGVSSNLSVWLKANAATNTTTDGAAISSWQDQSGNGNHFSQSTASSQPAYALTSSNFNPAITFDGSDLLSGPDTNYTGGVVFAVVNGTDNGNLANLLDDSGTSMRYEQNLNTGRLGYTRYGVSDYSSTVTTPFGRVSIISFSKASAATIYSIDELSNGTRSNATLDVGLATAGIPTAQMGIGLLGDVSEMIIYNNTLSAIDKSKVESYLSLKYGLTLDQNYLASDGTVIWNATINSAYQNAVAGIGRDDESALDQRKSKSVESSSVVTIDKGAVFSSDAAFVVWGHDNAATTFTSTNVPSGMDNRMLRVWKAAITGSPGTVSVSFEVATPLAVDRYKLLLDGTDSDFSAGATQHIAGVSVSGNTVTFTDVPLTDGMFFTLGTLSVGPGGIPSNLNVWLKGDAGTSALSTSWEDQSGNNRHYVTVAGPTVQSTALNFNPAVEILSGGFDAPAGAALGTDWSMFFVAKKLASDNNGRLFEGHTGNYLWGYWNTWERSIYIDGNPFEVNTGIGVNNGGTSLSLQSYTRNNSSGALEARHNGQSLKTFTSSNSASGVRVDINQGVFGGPESSDSHIGEFIIYNSTLGGIDVQKVESYLGIKYGLTLSQNYLASDGTIIWNTTTNSAYQNAVAGIGRDDNSSLDQRKSKSVESGSVVTIDKGAVFTSNSTFVVWGHDNAATTFAPSGVPPGIESRLERVWKTVVTGAPGNVSVSFELPSPGSASDYVLLLDGTDTDFTTGATQHTTGASVSGNTVTFTDVPLADGMFFTLATFKKGPGKVSLNLSVWLKANAGTNTTTDGAAISSWQDQSGNGNNFSQSTASSQPAYALTSSNFNPAITFDGLDGLAGPNTNYTGGVVFAVVNGTDNGNFANLLDGSATSIRYEQSLNTGRLGYTRYGVSDYSSTVTTPFGRVSIISFSKASAATIYSIDELSNGTRSNATLNVGLATAGIPTFQMGIGLLGDVSEMIIYNNTLSAIDKSKVESYLSLKYGLTLDQNYLASDGSILWNSTTNASYHNDVAGIGRDDQSELDQRKSKSVQSSSIITIDKGAAFSSDAAFVVWGHDNAATTFTSNNVPSGMDNRMLRVWKAAVTGNPGTVSVSFEVATPLAVDRYKLLLDGTDSDFSAGATEHITGVSVAGNTVTFTDVPLTDGMFFTLGTLSFGPGGIPTGLNVWLKGDAGTSALSTSWEDQSSNSRHYTTVAGPTVQSAALNFNPAIEILSGGFDAPAGAELGTDWSMFFVAKKLASDNNGRIFDGHSGNYLWGYITTYERSIYLNGNPSEYITGIAVNNGGINPSLQSYVRNNSSGALEARQNGQSLKTFASSNSASGVRVDINQGATNVAESSDSQVGEFIIYNSALGAADVRKVESYLGIKYGLTLNQNYLASDGTTIWNATNNSAYHNDIVAIGRDDNSLLLQKQSKSINSAGIVTIGLNDAGNNGLRNSNAENQGLISANRTFVFLGSDTEALNARIGSANPVSTDFPNNIAGLQTRLNREWKLVRTGTGVSSVIVQFDIQTIAGLGMGASPNDETQIVLLVDDNGDFTSGNPQAISQSFVTSNADNLVTFVVNFGPVNEVFLTLGSMEQSSLPVDLLSFDALQQGNEVQIDWSVADAVGEMIYTVERSSNGRDFQEVGKVEEATNGGGQYVYSFKDRPNASGQFYYRLSLIKPSGETDYSEVIRVLFEHKEPGKPVVPYPNPFVLAEGLRLSLPGDTRGKLEVSWTSSTGRLLKKEIVSYAKNESVLLLNSEGIQPGMLILQIRDLTNHQVWNFKVIAN